MDLQMLFYENTNGNPLVFISLFRAKSIDRRLFVGIVWCEFC